MADNKNILDPYSKIDASKASVTNPIRVTIGEHMAVKFNSVEAMFVFADEYYNSKRDFVGRAI